MLLPGGLWRAGERRRRFAFKPLTGQTELALAEGAEPGESLPSRVTALLAAALDQVGGVPAGLEVVRELCVGDRQFLARQLAARLGYDGIWLTARCGHCAEDFDFYLEQSALPVKEAPAAPRLEVETSLGICRVRPPTGADQEAVAEIEDPQEAVQTLVGLCVETVAGEPVSAPAGLDLASADLAAIEAAIEAAAPEVTLTVRARCPECQGETDVWVDPYLSLERTDQELFAEIHGLALAYGWSEPEILALPRVRRKLYLRLVDRSRGMVQ